MSRRCAAQSRLRRRRSEWFTNDVPRAVVRDACKGILEMELAGSRHDPLSHDWRSPNPIVLSRDQQHSAANLLDRNRCTLDPRAVREQIIVESRLKRPLSEELPNEI